MNLLSSVLSNVAPALASLAGGPLAGTVVSWLSNLFFGNESSSITDIVTAIKDPDNLFKLKELESQITLARLKSEDADKDRQTAVNLVEAQSESFWKAGARPAALWISVVGFAYNFIAVPIGQSLGVPMVVIASDQLMWLLGGLLGLGSMRTIEKIKGK
jgi:hypothetical protein